MDYAGNCPGTHRLWDCRDKKGGKMETMLFIYILSAIVVGIYIAYKYKYIAYSTNLYRKMYKVNTLNKIEMFIGISLAYITPILNTIFAVLLIMGVIVQGYYKIRNLVYKVV
jgi:hypothetical protein